MEVPARIAALTEAVRPLRVASFDPWKGRYHIGLVRRLVLGKAHVAVDPEERPRRVGGKWQAALRELLGESDAQGLEWLLEQAFVVGLPRLEPGAVVVRGEIRQELDGLGPKAGEGSAADRHGSLLHPHGRRSAAGVRLRWMTQGVQYG